MNINDISKFVVRVSAPRTYFIYRFSISYPPRSASTGSATDRHGCNRYTATDGADCGLLLDSFKDGIPVGDAEGGLVLIKDGILFGRAGGLPDVPDRLRGKI